MQMLCLFGPVALVVHFQHQPILQFELSSATSTTFATTLSRITNHAASADMAP